MTARYGAKSSAVFAFNPLSIAWDHAWWAEDPAWTPPADGGAVSSWRDAGVQAKNATATGANQPTYRASYAGLSNRRAIEFDGVDDFLDTAATTARTQPNHVVVIGYMSPTAVDAATPIDSSVTSTRHLMRPRYTATQVQMYAGISREFVAPPLPFGSPFIQIGLFSGATSECRLNSIVYNAAAVGDVGTHSIQNPRIGAGFGAGGTGHWKGALAFVGIKDTALTATEISNLEAWARAIYGVVFPITSPGEVSGLKAWYAADDASTITGELSHVDFPNTGSNFSIGNYLRVPNESAFNITGDITITTHVAPDLWSGAIANSIVSKRYSSGFVPPYQISWFFGIADNGCLRFWWSTDGSNSFEALSTIPPPGTTPGSWLWLAVTLDADNGAGSKVVTFWYATDIELIWRLVGTPVTTAGTTSIYASTADIMVNGFFFNDGAEHGYSFSGNVNQVMVGAGIGPSNGPVGAGITEKFKINHQDIPNNSFSTFKATSGQTVTINRGGSSPTALVTVPSTVIARVVQWRDKSGNAHHLDQTAQESKPVTGYSTVLVNGRNTMYFDGNDVIMHAANTGLNVGNATVFVVGGQTLTGEGVGLFTACVTGGSDWSSANAFTMTTGTASTHLQVERYYQAAGVGQILVPGTGITPPSIWVTQLSASGLMQAWRNGGVAATSTRGGTFGVASAGFLIGGRWQAGAIDVPYRLIGMIGEVIVYARALTLAEINLVGKYLADRWGYAWTAAT